jgi:hypothetical protein
MSGTRREAFAVIARLIRQFFFVRMAQIKKERAPKELVDLFFSDFVGCEEFAQIEVRESSIGHPGWKKFLQTAGIDGAQLANLFEDHPAQGIVEDGGIEQSADFSARPTLDQDGAQKAQGIPLESRPAVWFMCRHKNRFYFIVVDWICCRMSASTWAQTLGSNRA